MNTQIEELEADFDRVQRNIKFDAIDPRRIDQPEWWDGEKYVTPRSFISKMLLTPTGNPGTR